MNKKPLIHYVYHPLEKQRRVACIVATIRPDGKIGIGWSQCREDENFNKQYGREKALYRALHGDPKQGPPAQYKIYFANGTHFKVDPVTQQLNLLKFRALNYFSPELAPEHDTPVGELTDLVFTIGPKPLVPDNVVGQS